MAVKIDAEIKGMKDTQRNMEQAVKDLRGTPIANAMRDATLLITRDAKVNAPVDTGRLRASITPEVRSEGETVKGVVGSNVSYAPFVELGTRPHWVPKGALAVWARRHNMPESAVRWSIAQHGTSQNAVRLHGTKGYEYLQRAFIGNKSKIETRFNQAIAQIARDANQ